MQTLRQALTGLGEAYCVVPPHALEMTLIEGTLELSRVEMSSGHGIFSAEVVHVGVDHMDANGNVGKLRYRVEGRLK